MATSMALQLNLLLKIRNFAVLSRVLVCCVQVISNFVLPDHEAGVFNPPTENRSRITDQIISLLFEGFRRWDAIYFTHVAQYWYTYENCLAFFPLYPLLVNLLSKTVFYPLQFLMAGQSVILLSSVVLNLFLFIQTSKLVFKLGQIVLKNDMIAYKAALLFCINPASIFMTAPYSEILYMYLTLRGLILIENDSMISSSVFFGLASVARSNGLINNFYMLHKSFKRTIFSYKNLFKMKNDIPMLSLLWIFCLRLIYRCVPLALSILPFILYQYYSYSLYCVGDRGVDIPQHLVEYGRNQDLTLVGDSPSSWCNDTIPIAYSYIQKHHWNQGFLQYWEFKQIPNFLLATPVTILVIGMAVNFYRNNRYVCHSLGLDDEGAMKKDDPLHHKEFRLYGPTLLPYVVHAVALTLFGVFCIHVQVLTRLLFSSVPVLYWYSAYLITPNAPVQQQTVNRYDIFTKSKTVTVEPTENMNSSYHNLVTRQISNFKGQSLQSKIVLAYYLGYLLIGTVLFSNFLPWT